MGLFSGISKAFKSITKGIKKAFSGIVRGVKGLVKGAIRAVGKIANSKWGKILLTGAALFTGAMAISGAVQGWGAAAQMQGATFMDKFVAGAKGFMSALANPVDQAKSLMGGTEALAQAGTGAAGAAGKLGSGAAQQAQAGIQQAAGMGQVTTAVAPPSQLASGGALTQAATQGATQGVAQTAGQAAGQVGAEAGKSWLTKAGEFAKEFIAPAIPDLIKGAGEGYAREQELKMQYEHESRIQRAWEDPNNALAKLTRSSGFGSFGTPRGAGNQPIYNPGGPIGPGGPMTTQGALPGEPVPVGG